MPRGADLPEPEWRARARYLKALGFSNREIGNLLNKHKDTVRNVFDLKRLAYQRQWTRLYKQNKPTIYVPGRRDYKRQEARELARERWRGENYRRDLKWYYRDLDCM